MSDRRRVLFCTLGYEPGPVGGAERQARLQAEELQRRGWRVDVVTARDPGTRSERLSGVAIRRLPRWNRHLLRTITYLPMLGMFLIFRGRRYDLVHVHLANLQADVAGVATRLLGLPLYIKIAAGGPRGEIARMRKVSWLTRYVGIRSAKRLQATSLEIVDDLRSIGVPDNDIVQIPNGLPARAFQPIDASARQELRAQLGLPQDEVILLYAGRFATYKGVRNLVEAWDRRQSVARATLLLVGAPAIDDPVEISSADKLIVMPWASDVVPYLQASDIYVHPSLSDGMPNSVLEAMASGMPVIATRIAAVPEMISDGESGVLVEPGDVEGLARAMDRLTDDAPLRQRLGAAAAARAASTYQITAVVDRIEAAYWAMLSSTTEA